MIPLPSLAPRSRALLLLLALVLVLAVPPPGAARAEGARWQWPLPPPHEVLARFEAPATPYGPGHRGIDIAAAAGAEVRAVEAGTVRHSGAVAGRGVVSVVHADGLISTYEPVTGTLAAGARVGAASHCAGRDCLHLGARRGESYVDPLLLLGERGPSVLLPWEGEGGTGSVPGSGPAPGPGSARDSGPAPGSAAALRSVPSAAGTTGATAHGRRGWSIA
jgi:hypothetical protein